MGLGISSGYKFLNFVSGDFDPPPGSQGYDDKVTFDTLFPAQADQTVYVIVFVSPNNNITAANNKTKDWTEEILNKAYDWDSSSHNKRYIVGNLTYWQFNNALAQKKFLSNSSQAMVAIIYTRSSRDTSTPFRFIENVRDTIDSLDGYANSGWYVGLTGPAVLLYDSTTDTEKSITEVDIQLVNSLTHTLTHERNSLTHSLTPRWT